MSPRDAAHPGVDDIDLVTVLSAMGDPVRMTIVQTLSEVEGEQPWSRFTLPIARSTLSHHIKVLRNAGIVRSRHEGTRCFVSLRRDDLDFRFPGLLESVLRNT